MSEPKISRPMKLDDAITHCLQKAQACTACGEEHRQLGVSRQYRPQPSRHCQKIKYIGLQMTSAKLIEYRNAIEREYSAAVTKHPSSATS